MSESLRNDGRVWVPKTQGRRRASIPIEIAEDDRDYYLERKYPSFGNLSPRDIASARREGACDDGRGVGPGGRGVYLDFRDAIKRDGEDRIREKYGNLFDMYERITGENPYRVPMRIYPAVHYTMGGLWVDYQLQTTIPGLFCLGEANFSDHGANRLGASALMQGLADGYFIIPYTLGNYLAGVPASSLADPTSAAFTTVEAEVRGAPRPADRRARQALGRLVPQGARPHHVGGLRHGAQQASRSSTRSPRSRSCASSSGATSPSSASATRSTSRSRRPAASPTSWSSPS